jgi:hypothetical protein
MVEELSKHVLEADLRRLDLNGNTLDVMIYISARRDRDIVAVLSGLQLLYPQANITFVEQGSYFDG